MPLFGSNYSSSTTNTTNTTTTTTTTIADAFNNALNTTQNFANIGGYSPTGDSGATGGILLPIIILGALGALFFLTKGKH